MEPRWGIVLDSLGQPVKEALQTAAGMGFRRIEMSAVSGPVSPSELGGTGRRHLLHMLGGLGLQLSALGGDLGGGRFADSARLEQALERTKDIVELAADLHVPIVTTHLGHADQEVLNRGYLVEAVEKLAEICDRTGTFIAFETAGADPTQLAELLHRLNASTLGVCYDPASLLIEGFEPLAGVEKLADSILIARARDALTGSSRSPGREVPLGRGQLDLAEYLAALDQAGYRDVPFIRRTDSDRPLEDVTEARVVLERFLR